MATTVQDALAALEFGLELDDDELVTDAVIVLRITRMGDGRSTVGFTKSDTADAVIVAGLIECARQLNDGGWGDPVEDE